MKLSDQTPRPETGPMQFGNDWPGVFIRGDNALYFGTVLAAVLKELPDDHPAAAVNKAVLMGLADDLLSCEVHVTDPLKMQYAQLIRKVVEIDPHLRR